MIRTLNHAGIISLDWLRSMDEKFDERDTLEDVVDYISKVDYNDLYEKLGCMSLANELREEANNC